VLLAPSGESALTQAVMSMFLVAFAAAGLVLGVARPPTQRRRPRRNR
jgi:hypothetical protein